MPAVSSSESFKIPLKTALSIATSDSGGGAGTQADLKTFAAHNVYGLSVLSAVSAQNTVAVTALECLSPSMVNAQLKAIYDDIEISAIKIGLLGNVENTKTVISFLSKYCRHIPIILDPVMVSTSGHSFLPEDAIAELKVLMGQATLITPNILEAEKLWGHPIKSAADQLKAGHALLSLGPKNVLVKGGHGKGPQADDLLVGEEGEYWFKGSRINTPNDHGTGCTLSSAICANLAKGLNLKESTALAKEYVRGGLINGIFLGKGPGPINHFFPYYNFKSPQGL